MILPLSSNLSKAKSAGLAGGPEFKLSVYTSGLGPDLRVGEYTEGLEVEKIPKEEVLNGGGLKIRGFLVG